MEPQGVQTRVAGEDLNVAARGRVPLPDGLHVVRHGAGQLPARLASLESTLCAPERALRLPAFGSCAGGSTIARPTGTPRHAAAAGAGRIARHEQPLEGEVPDVGQQQVPTARLRVHHQLHDLVRLHARDEGHDRVEHSGHVGGGRVLAAWEGRVRSSEGKARPPGTMVIDMPLDPMTPPYTQGISVPDRVTR